MPKTKGSECGSHQKHRIVCWKILTESESPNRMRPTSKTSYARAFTPKANSPYPRQQVHLMKKNLRLVVVFLCASANFGK